MITQSAVHTVAGVDLGAHAVSDRLRLKATTFPAPFHIDCPFWDGHASATSELAHAGHLKVHEGIQGTESADSRQRS